MATLPGKFVALCVLAIAVAATEEGEQNSGKYIEIMDNLLHKLQENYNPMIVPQVDISQPIEVEIHFMPITVDLDDHNVRFYANGYLQTKWKDFRLMWNRTNYHNIYSVGMPITKIWIPDIVPYHGEKRSLAASEILPVINDYGYVTWIPQVELSARCSLDMRKYPFDRQTCQITFGSWIYHGLVLNITTLYGGTTLYDYQENKKWKMINASGSIVTTYYPCCQQPYKSFVLKFVLQRNPVFYTHILIMPALLLAILVPSLFMLPADSKERITLGSVLLLAIFILISIVQNMLPSEHESVPIIVVYYLVTLTWVSLSLLLSTVVLNVHNRGLRRKKVPEILRKIFLRSLRRLVCLDGDSYYALYERETVSMRGLDREADTAVPQQNESRLERDVSEIKNKVKALVVRSTVLEAQQEIMGEWQQVALVIDRILCILFTITFAVSTIAIFA